MDDREPERLTKTDTQKLLSVARQCLDRIDALTSELKDDEVVVPTTRQPETPPSSSSNSPRADMLVSRPLAYLSAVRIFPDDRKVPAPKANSDKGSKAGSASSLQLNLLGKRNSILEAINWISPEEAPSLEDELNTLKEISSPLERASRENEALIASYRVRIERAATASARSNLQLELQRRIAENLDMARQKQETFATEMKRQRQRHLENAALMLRLRSNDIATKKMLHLLEETLEYEEKRRLFAQLRVKLEELPVGPADSRVVQTIVRKTLMDPNHPLSKEVNTSARQILERIRSHRDVVEENNNNSSSSDDAELLEDEMTELNVSKDETVDRKFADLEEPPPAFAEERAEDATDFEDIYRSSVDQVKSALADSKETMKSLEKKENKKTKKNKLIHQSRSKSALKKSLKKHKLNDVNDADGDAPLKRHFDDCVRMINDTLERLIDSFVLVYGQTLDDDHARDECRIHVENHFYPPIYPSLFAVCRSVCSSQEKRLKESMERLVDCRPLDLGYRDEACSSDAAGRCQEAAIVLGQLVDHNVPNEKLRLLVRVAKEICGTRNVTENGPPTKSISADDLIPLLSYACIRASKPQLATETFLLEALTNQKNMMGEEGYCLTSLQTSLQYITSLPGSGKLCLESTV